MAALPIGSERAAVQNLFLRYAEEAGWTYLPRDEALDQYLPPLYSSVVISHAPNDRPELARSR